MPQLMGKGGQQGDRIERLLAEGQLPDKANTGCGKYQYLS